MFHQEFYPTPIEVLDQMGIDCLNKVVLEPSAGKGDIIDYLKKWGASEVLACEIHDDLRKIVATKANVIGSDFLQLKAESISHIDMIVMNPPFSNADRHIMHAWEIAPEGCEIISLCNWQTINNSYGYGRNSLKATIENYGEAVNMGDCFKYAERRTGVEVGMIRLFKPRISDGDGFEDFYLTSDEQVEDNAVISYNEIKAVVNSYTAAVRCYDKVQAVAEELKAYTNVSIVGKQKEDGTYETHHLRYGDGIVFMAGSSQGDQVISKQDFARNYQKVCWSFIFRRVGIEKYVTKGVLEDINKFIHNRKNYPFTVRNIGKMLDIIVGTRADIMNRAIVEAVDNFTRHTDDNRYGVEGWKTNSGHLLNKKFITGWIAERKWGGGLQIKWHNSQFERINDLTKALCFITGKKFEDIPDIRLSSCRLDENGNKIKTSEYRDEYAGYDCFTPNQWYDWGFFQFKVFKKGTGHFKFKDENVWAELNRAYAKIKGQALPEKL